MGRVHGERQLNISIMISSRAILRVARASAPQRVAAPRVLAASQIRSYAAPAAASPDSKPPIALYGLDGTYATALYTAAVKNSTLDSTAKAIAALNDVTTRMPSWPRLCKHLRSALRISR